MPQGRRQVLRSRSTGMWRQEVSGKSSGNRAGQRAEAAIAPVVAELDLVDADFQHVARLGAGNGDRPGDQMCPGARGHWPAWIAASAGGMVRPEPGGGITSGPPETHSSTTVSPEFTVISGGKAGVEHAPAHGLRRRGRCDAWPSSGRRRQAGRTRSPRRTIPPSRMRQLSPLRLSIGLNTGLPSSSSR